MLYSCHKRDGTLQRPSGAKSCPPKRSSLSTHFQTSRTCDCEWGGRGWEGEGGGGRKRARAGRKEGRREEGGKRGRVGTRQRVAQRESFREVCAHSCACACTHTHTYVHMRACMREATCIQMCTRDCMISRTSQKQARYSRSVSSGCAATR